MEGLSPFLGAIAGALLPPGLPRLPVPDDLGPIPVMIPSSVCHLTDLSDKLTFQDTFH